MMKHRLLAGLAGACLLAAPLVAIAAGSWPNWPVVGGASYCSAIVGSSNVQAGTTGQGAGAPGSNGVYCAQTVPQGPTYSGEELIPADVGGSNGGTPTQSAVIPSSILGSVNAKTNRLQGGDFTTNLWQRGTTPLSGASPTTYQMAADRWFAISASNVMTVSKSTPSSSAADYIGNLGFASWMRVARPSGTPTGSSCVGQILDQKASEGLLGNNGVLSFYGYAPATFSATNENISVSVAYYTAGDSATPGTNTATFALSASGQAGGIAGYTAATAGASPGTTGVLASGVETIALSTTPTRYSVYAPIPAATAAGTQVIGVGISFCATPILTTTVSTDYFEIAGVQLQALPSAVTTALPAGVTSPTGFDRLSPALEAARELAYSYVMTDGAITRVFGWCQETTANTSATCISQFPQEMREVPTTTVSAAGWSVQQTNATDELCSALAGVASTNTILNGGLLCTNPGTIAIAVMSPWLGGATTSTITFSAEP